VTQSVSAPNALADEIRRLAGATDALDCSSILMPGGIPAVEAHPLGMFAVKFPGVGRTVRLHVWTPETAQFRDDWGAVHDHVWHLRSFVVRGAIDETRYALESTTHGDCELWYHDYRSSRLVRAGKRVKAAPIGGATHASGAVYDLRAGRLHATVAHQPITVTLLEARPTCARRARIVGGPNVPDVHAARLPVSLDDVIDVLRAVG
jgi:hypothetical protein